MNPMFRLKETRLYDPRQEWRGRTVLDRYGRTIGQVLDILVEERTLEEAVRQDGDAHAWTVRPIFATVRVGSGWLSRLNPRRVILPIASLREENGVLVADDEDRDQIRVTLAA